MTIARIKVWDPGEILTAPDLNDEFDNLVNNQSSVEITATGSTTADSLADRFARQYWLEDFGTPGTGSDTTLLQLAINTVSGVGGGILRLGHYTLTITASVTIPSYVTLHGSGIGVTIIRASSSLPLGDPMLMGATGDTGFGIRVDTDITLRDITFDGIGRTYPAWDLNTDPPFYGGLSAADMRGNLIRFYSATNVKIQSCEIMNHNSLTLSLAGSKGVLVESCYFHGNGKVDDVSPAIYAPEHSFPNSTPTTDIQIRGNYFYDNLRSAILFSPTGGGSIIGNRFLDNGESTIFGDNGVNIIISHNYILRSNLTDIVGHGIELNETVNSKICNNIIEGTDTSGINCNGMTDGSINDNIIINPGQATTYPGGPFNFAAGRAAGDPLTDTKRSGITLETGNLFKLLRVSVSNNQLIDNQGSPTMQYGVSVVRSGTPTFTAVNVSIFDNFVSGSVLSTYNFVRQACSATVKLRDRGWPAMLEIQVPATTGEVTYDMGYHPSLVQVHATLPSSTQIFTSFGVAMFNPSVSAEAERGQRASIDEATPNVTSNRFQNVLVQVADETGTTVTSGNLTAWTDTGITIDWTVVTQRPYLVIQTWP
jgi:hypothetical protein